MKGDEVIDFKTENSAVLNSAAQMAFQKTLLHFPFECFGSINKTIELQIRTNFERNLALELLHIYASEKDIMLDWPTDFPFFRRQYIDFNFQNNEWVLMNKVVRKSSTLTPHDYIFLPALIPNRHIGDRWIQWRELDTKKASNFLFTFLVPENTDLSRNGFSMDINSQTLQFLESLAKKYRSIELESSPYTPAWFWSEIEKRGVSITLDKRASIRLVICGVAGSEQYSFFKDIDGVSDFGYALYTGRWYNVEETGMLSFSNGAVNSHFKNATCPMAALQSFKSLVYPRFIE